MDQLFNNEQVEYELPEEKEDDAKKNAPKTPAHKNMWDAFWHCTKKENKVVFYIKETIEYVLIVILAFVVATLVNMYIFRLSRVVGHSMDQSYHDGQQVWLTKLPYIFGEPERGDVVIVDSTKVNRTFFVDFADSVKSNAIVRWFVPEKALGEGDRLFIKRIIAVGGDTIEFKENAVWVNGEKLDERAYVNPEEVPNYSDWEGLSYTVSDGCAFVMGDNRNHSEDSRYYGEFPVNCLLGKVMVKGKTND